MERSFRPSEGKRLDAFVDSAFAFAVSLLIIAGGQPMASFDDLMRALMRVPAFLAGFALIVLFWMAHRTWSALEPQRNAQATWLSLAIVFMVLIFVFPLRLLTETATHFLSGGLLPGAGLIRSLDQLGWTYLVYGIGFAILSALFALLFRQARASIAPDRVRSASQWSRTWTLAAVAGVLSGLLALTPVLRAAPWAPGMIYWIIPLGLGLGLASGRRAKA
ncbi:TMEM175 family protein [Brevundimonas sp. R86498]|uniref:TMEM175 family protein n=1 Tax=Brevundimonas sp. R86498 TaxID=3093845 RepID=UPI0037CB2A59